mmetsp:Transcript_15113/g.22183  ORF Transcript_15113/g.22183 Transcript_15113/m.22183 type:complete len:136 (-) Transcript_15113:500-907(-)
MLTFCLVSILSAVAHSIHITTPPCAADEVRIQVELILSELAIGSGWNLADKDGNFYMGSCAGCSRPRHRRSHSISDCISRSKCGGDGGDGRLILSFEGTGYYEGHAVSMDGVLAHFGSSDARTKIILQCANSTWS